MWSTLVYKNHPFIIFSSIGWKPKRVPTTRLLGVGGGGHSWHMTIGLCDMENVIGIFLEYSSTSFVPFS
jgi:hypothetical protein